jgi:protein SCO1/2
MTSPEPSGGPDPRVRIVWIVLVLALAAVVGVAAVSMRSRPGAALDRLGPAPAFTLTSQAGTPFPSTELAGEVWLADFMFTTCRGICPILTNRLLEVQERMDGRDGWHMVSFSVDPGTDTPEVLTAYAEKHGADLDRWTFLTGDKKEIFKIISDGFHLVVEEGAGDEAEPTLHSPRIVLVDAEGEIRGYYDSLDDESMALMVKHLESLLDG